MYKIYIFLLGALFLMPGESQAQKKEHPLFGQSEKRNSLVLDVRTHVQNIVFAQPRDYQSSKVLNNYFRLRVDAPEIPWVVTASFAAEQTGLSPTAAAALSQLIQIQVNNGPRIRLSERPQPIISYNQNNPNRTYQIDLIVDPPFNIDLESLLGLINFNLKLL